jgi:hypothetical protein
MLCTETFRNCFPWIHFSILQPWFTWAPVWLIQEAELLNQSQDDGFSVMLNKKVYRVMEASSEIPKESLGAQVVHAKA